MIKISIASLPVSGFDVKQKIAAKTINDRLLAAPDSATNKIEFSEEIAVDVHVEKVPHGVTAEGQIKADCSQVCSRCAESVIHPVNCPIRHVFKHHTNPDLPLPEEDIGVSYYREEHIELGTVIEDLLILNLSPYWHPEDEANGNCSHCKKNFREQKKAIKLGTQGLGDALKKAGIS